MVANSSLVEIADWIEIAPAVNAEAEFLEIASDFGNPLEIIREGLTAL